MRRLVASCMVAGLILASVAVVPVAAGSRQAVTMTVTTIFGNDANDFSADGLGENCTWGLVHDGGAHVQFTPAQGIFGGYKVFDCQGGGENGFVVRLNARFGGQGSVGSWAVVGAWGSLAGMWGAGKLAGDPINGGIIDHYRGTVTF